MSSWIPPPPPSLKWGGGVGCGSETPDETGGRCWLEISYLYKVALLSLSSSSRILGLWQIVIRTINTTTTSYASNTDIRILYYPIKSREERRKEEIMGDCSCSSCGATSGHKCDSSCSCCTVCLPPSLFLPIFLFLPSRLFIFILWVSEWGVEKNAKLISQI